MRRISLFFVLLLSSLLIAGCGGGDSSSTKSGSEIVGADLAPANASAFLSLNTDVTNEQWTQAKALLAKSPANEALEQLLGDSGMSLADIEQALGKHTVVIGLAGGDEDSDAVMLTDTSDPEKLKSLLASGKSTKNAVTREIGDWTAASDSAATLDSYESATSSGAKLADSADFKAAIAGLPDDALATLFFPGDALEDTVESRAPGSASSIITGATGNNPIKWVGLSLASTANGISVEGLVKGSRSLGDGTTALLQELPAGTSFAIDLDGGVFGLDKMVRDLRNNDQYGSQISQFETMLGLTLEDLAALVGGEIAVYGNDKGIGILVKTAQPNKVLGALDKVAGMVGGGGATPTTIGDVQAKKLALGAFQIFYGTSEGNLFIVSDETTLPGSAKLTGDASYSSAAEAMDIPDQAAVVFYLNFPQLSKLIETMSSLFQSLGASGTSGMTEITSSLEGYDTVLGYAAANGDVIEFKASVTVK